MELFNDNPEDMKDLGMTEEKIKLISKNLSKAIYNKQKITNESFTIFTVLQNWMYTNKI